MEDCVGFRMNFKLQQGAVLCIMEVGDILRDSTLATE